MTGNLFIIDRRYNSMIKHNEKQSEPEQVEGTDLIKCNEGCTNGIFYIIDDSLEDSFSCGNCHGKGWLYK